MKSLLVVLLALSTQAFALEGSFLRDYHPLGKNLKLERVVACTESTTSSTAPSTTNTETPLEQVCQTRFGRSSLHFMPANGDTQPTLTVQPAKGAAFKVQLESMPMYFEQMYAADLNRDGREDYILELPWGGNGIAGSVVVFALSSKTGYRITAMNTLLFDPYALVKMGGKFPNVIHTALVSATGTDKREHSFWVHHFFNIQGDALVESTRIPVWVQYTFTPRAIPTILLTKAEKKRAWADYLSNEITFFMRVK